jgi:PIN domain nuclease of toxin-antitoxin system
MTEDPKLSDVAKALIRDKSNAVHVSVGSAWEFAIKVGLGRWPEAENSLLGLNTICVMRASSSYQLPFRMSVPLVL